MVEEDPASTSLKTHRYLRLSLVFVVFALLTSVLIQTVVTAWDPLTLGWNLLPSISHYFYTPARNIFVGSLIAASLALLALSGRHRAATLLDVSAIFAPLIALIPTGIAPDQIVDGLTCRQTEDCVPVEYLGDLRVGVATYVIVVIAMVITLTAIRTKKEIRTQSARLVSTIAVVTAVVLAALAFIPALNADFPFNFWPFPQSIHFAATLLFFGTFAAVPIMHSFGSVDDNETAPTPRQQAIYRWITWLMVANLVMLFAGFILRRFLGDFPIVLIGEAIALCLFAWFWWVQTFQRWNDPDAPYLT